MGVSASCGCFGGKRKRVEEKKPEPLSPEEIERRKHWTGGYDSGLFLGFGMHTDPVTGLVGSGTYHYNQRKGIWSFSTREGKLHSIHEYNNNTYQLEKIVIYEGLVAKQVFPSLSNPSVEVVESPKVDPVVVEPPKADPVVAEPSKADPVVAEPSKADLVVAEPSKADPVVTEPVKTEASTDKANTTN